MISNAIVFKAELPSIESLRQHFAELAYRELSDTEYKRHCFVMNEVTGDLVTDFPGGFAICLRTDEKVIPPKVLQAETDKEVTNIEEAQGTKVPRKTRQAIKEEIFFALCEQALVSTSYTWAFYHQEHQLLIVNTGGKSKADALVNSLISAAGSVKTQTIHISDIKHGITSRLQKLIEGEDDQAFGQLDVDDHALLVRRFEEVEKVTYAGVDITGNQELLDQLRAGYRVEDLGMIFDRTHFRLTSEFRLKCIKREPIDSDEDDDDHAHQWRMQAHEETQAIAGIVAELCQLLEYKEEEVAA
ncbi:recombination associated protein RdgC [Onishia taeanensis]|uniref:Recombination-associated protein RdgC n=1 Tax=Onishia taeanensis TaxID=284577 RepID=A0A1G7NF74_9GAMM|nr:recombination-associated protein RdgC [Halomonas taeanensis]SDF71949.1 recombination associated protein RdgC [Halomonas taeanensis]